MIVPNLTKPNAGVIHLWISLGWSLLAFSLSYFLLPFYVGGDQEFYRLLYDEIALREDWSAKFIFYKNTVDAAEPVYLLIVNAFSPYIEKDLFFSIINATIFGIVAFFVGRNSLYVLNFFFLTNFYFMTLAFSAERLKVGLLVVLFGLLCSRFWRWFFIVLACFSHFQLFFFAASIFLYDFDRKNGRKLFLGILAFSLIVFGGFYYVGFIDVFIDHVIGKKDVYNSLGWGGYVGVLKPFIFLLGALVCASDKTRAALTCLPILLASYFFGSERFALFAFFIMTFFALLNPIWRSFFIVIPSLIYFSYSGFVFVFDFLRNGSVNG